MFFQGGRVLMLSQGENEATELLDKARFIYRQLPDFLQVTLGKDQGGLITFSNMYSSILALPSTQKAGHGYSASLVIRDELEHHPFAQANMLAVGPSIDAGGQQIDLSTVDKTKADTHFKTRYKTARAGDSNAYPIFLPWHLRPVREKGMSLVEWFMKNIRRKYSQQEIEQEYPETEQAALGVLGASSFFDIDALNDMERDCYPPIETRHDTMVKIWKPPMIGQRYVLATDPSTGQEDPHAIVVIDWATQEEVATSHGRCPAEVVAQIHDELTRHYNDAFNTYERNAIAGGVLEQKLKELGTPNQYRPNASKKHANPNTRMITGWWSGGNERSNKRLDLLWRLQVAVRNRQIRIHNFEALNDFRWFIQPEGEPPKATQGKNDDFVMAWAIALETRKMLPVYAGGVGTYKIRRV